MYQGRITRVRMDAEGTSQGDVVRALDDGFGVIFRSLCAALEAGALHNDFGPLVFTRESEFGEEVIESKIDDETGAVSFVGRRVVKFEQPDPATELAIDGAPMLVVEGELPFPVSRIRVEPERGTLVFLGADDLVVGQGQLFTGKA